MNIQEHNTKVFSSIVDKYKKNTLRIDEEEVIKHFKAGKILVLGCGAGRTLKPLKDKGFEVYGLDISKAMVKEARKITKVICDNAINIEKIYKPDYFDCIFFPFHGIDHVHPFNNRDKILKGVHKILKKNGVFIYSTHNIFFPRTFFNYLKCGGGYVKLSKLWVSVVTSIGERLRARKYFKVKIISRNRLIPNKCFGIKGRIIKLFPIIDKSIYIICKKV